MNNFNQEEKIDLRQILERFVSKWYFFLITLAISISLAYMVIQISPKIYEVYSILKMNVGSSKSEKILDATQLDKREVNIEDKIVEIKSTKIIREAIHELDFGISYFTKGDFVTKERYKLNYPISVKIDSTINNITDVPIFIRILNNSEFELAYKIEDLSNVGLYNFKEDFEIKQQFNEQNIIRKYKFDIPIKDQALGLGFTISLIGDPKQYKDDDLYFVINNLNNVTEKYLKKLNLEAFDRKSEIIYLRIGSNIIQKEKAFLNTLMDVIISKNLEEKNQEALKTIDFIDYQLADASSSLNKAESDLESIGYTTTNIGESSVLFEQRNQLESQIASYNVQLKNLRNYLGNLERLEGSANSLGSLDIDDPMIENLLIQLTALYQQRANLKRTATEANPIIQRVNLEITTTKETLRNALNGAINNLNAVTENLNYRLAQTKATINKLPGAERRKLGIQRKFEFSDNTYDLFMQRKAAAGIALATNDSDWSIVENAKNDGLLLSPKIKFIYTLAIFLGLLIPSVVILVLDKFDNRIKNKTDLEKVTPIPILGTIIKGSKLNKLATQYNSNSALLESFRDLRINLQYLSLTNNENNIIGITSSTSGEGKTFCAVNLAIVLAQSGKKVLVLDADLRNSTMAEFIGNNSGKYGFSSYLIGTSNLEDSISKSQVKNLDIIFSGPTPPNPSDLISLPRTNILIAELRKRYEYIIIDCPPIGLVGDYLIMSKFYDTNIYITRYKYTRKNSFDKINKLFIEKNLNNLSLVLNDVKQDLIYGSNPYYIDGNFKRKKVRNKLIQATKS